MDHEFSLEPPTTEKVHLESMTEPRRKRSIPNNPNNSSSERIIPINISPKPFTKLKKSTLNQDNTQEKSIDARNNNDYYKQVSEIINNNNNENSDDLQRRSLLVTLEDGSTTETLGSIRDIELDQARRKSLENENVEELNTSNNNKSSQQQYSNFINR